MQIYLPVPPCSLILASASPRRAQLLHSAGIPFTLAASPVEEPPPTTAEHHEPGRYVERLARLKAETCTVENAAGRTLVLAADTIVWHDGKILGKPRDAAEASAMLRSLCGHSHQVFTGVCLREGKEFRTAHDTTRVSFYERSDEWIARYVAGGEPMDKAGAYAAQGRGAFLLRRIEGDFSNVVGLPMGLLGRMLNDVGVDFQLWW